MLSRRISPIILYLILGCTITWSSCKPIDVFETNTGIPGYQWKSNFIAKGTFQVTDTLSAYQIFIVLRHTDAYAYNNIWLDVGLQSPGDSLYTQKVNLTLANDAQGWEGTGMNDIWEVRKLLNAEPKRFKKAGTYQFSIRQIMRDDPLPHVMSAGLRVEKAIR